jgi:osmoprotectant transport system ATP-binding protein
MIELNQVSKRFGNTVAADELTLHIERGECVVLLGPSGSGKSTALKLINRLVELDRGDIRFDGRDIRSYAPEQLRRQMGYVIQSIGLFPHWTVARNIATVPALLGWSRARTEARVDELLELLGLPPSEMRQRYPHQISGGQQQRVGVARALAAQPQVLLMDEPFGALDPLMRQELQRELARIQRSQGQTIVMVTHDVDEALFLATRIVLLDQGRIVQQATPRELLRHPANEWVANFLGRADHGQRMLALQTVGERMRGGGAMRAAGGASAEAARAAAAQTDATLGPAGDRVPLHLSMTLRDALGQFLALRCLCLPVVDDSGAVVGELHLSDLIEPEA